MTPEEKGALLLAYREGKNIQVLDFGKWNTVPPLFSDRSYYRIKPEPKRETAALYGRVYTSTVYPDGVFDADHRPRCAGDTHRITFDTIDSKPDCASIRMERLT